MIVDTDMQLVLKKSFIFGFFNQFIVVVDVFAKRSGVILLWYLLRSKSV